MCNLVVWSEHASESTLTIALRRQIRNINIYYEMSCESGLRIRFNYLFILKDASNWVNDSKYIHCRMEEIERKQTAFNLRKHINGMINKQSQKCMIDINKTSAPHSTPQVNHINKSIYMISLLFFTSPMISHMLSARHRLASDVCYHR